MDIDELRDLKTRVARESTRLREATEEQKRNEEQTRSRLRRRIETPQASLNEAQEQAATDPLTGDPQPRPFRRDDPALHLPTTGPMARSR